MTVSIPQSKIEEILLLVNDWLPRETATKHDLQVLLGKLNWVAQCVRPGRLFVARMLQSLREAHTSAHVTLTDEFRADLSWWAAFLPQFNGISCIKEIVHQFDVRVDSCLTGAGGTIQKTNQSTIMEFYGTPYKQPVTNQQLPISQLECLNCLAALRLWQDVIPRSNVRLQCDNSATVSILQSGRGVEKTMLATAREIWMLQAKHQFHLTVIHCPGRLMAVPDALSRRHMTAYSSQISAELQSAREREMPAQNFSISS